MNFDEWWNEDYDDKNNPFEKDSFGYWAYAGWCAAMQVEEPVGYADKYDLEREDHDFWVSRQEGKHTVPLYATQPEQEPIALKVYQGEICYLSQDDDQSFGMWCPVDSNTDLGLPNETIFYTAQQAPVARVNRDGFIVETGFGLLEGTLLYTSPPIREWVGLTDEEVQLFADNYLDVGDGEGGKHYVCGDVDFARAIEAKLKEKNT